MRAFSAETKIVKGSRFCGDCQAFLEWDEEPARGAVLDEARPNPLPLAV